MSPGPDAQVSSGCAGGRFRKKQRLCHGRTISLIDAPSAVAQTPDERASSCLCFLDPAFAVVFSFFSVPHLFALLFICSFFSPLLFVLFQFTRASSFTALSAEMLSLHPEMVVLL